MKNLHAWIWIGAAILAIGVIAVLVSGCGLTVTSEETMRANQATIERLNAEVSKLQQDLSVCKVASERASLAYEIQKLQTQIGSISTSTAKPDD